MDYLEEIFTVFDDNLINHIPTNIDKKNPHLFFTYYYEHFAISIYDIFSKIEVADDKLADPLKFFLYKELKKYEKANGKIEDINKKWLLMHIFVLHKCAVEFGLLFMERIIERIEKKIDEIDEKYIMYYINQFNLALISDIGVALVPRPIEICKSQIDKIQGFTPFFNEVLKTIEMSKKILTKRVKASEIKDLSEYMDPEFMKYTKKHDVLAEYFSGVIVVKKEIILKNIDDSEAARQMKMEILEDEVDKFIKLTCDIDNDRMIRLKEELIDLIETIAPEKKRA